MTKQPSPLLPGLPLGERGVHTLRTWDAPRCDLLAAGHIDLAPGARYAFDNRARDEDACVFQLTLAGEGSFAEDGEESPLRAGDAFLVGLPSPTAYGIAHGESWRFAYVYFTGDLARSHVRGINRRRGRRFPITAGDPSLAPLRALLACLRETADPGEAIASTLLYALLTHLHTAAPAAAEAGIAAARRLADERSTDPELGVARLAEAAGCSRGHLSRRFRDAYGVSPYAYLLAVRLRHAQRLLLEGDAEAREVARHAGFGDAAHFNRLFRAHVGMPPGAYRRRARGV